MSNGGAASILVAYRNIIASMIPSHEYMPNSQANTVGTSTATRDATQATKVDAAGVWIAALALIVAPTHIWALGTWGSQGITLSYIVAVPLIALGLLRLPSTPLSSATVLAVQAGIGVWGVALAVFAFHPILPIAKNLDHAVLYAICQLSLLGGARVRFSWEAFEKPFRWAQIIFVLVVAYGLYQTFARRYGWPYAFLEVHNPSLSTDFVEGYQPGASELGQGHVYASRASSFFVEPTNLGMYLGYGLAVSFAMLERGGRWGRRGRVGLFLAAIGFVGNQSLTGLLAISTVVFVNLVKFFVRGRILRGWVALLLLSVGLAGLMAVPGAYENIIGRLTGLNVEESSGRFTTAPEVFAAFFKKPFGHGIGNHITVGEGIHNGVLLMLAQFGVVGMLTPLLWLGAIVYGIVSRPPDEKSSGGGNSALAASLLAVHLSIWTSSGLMYDPLAWSASGLAFGLLAREKSRWSS